jgi:transposase-like protein
LPIGQGGRQFSRQVRRRGQRVYSDATRRRALELAIEGRSPVEVAEQLGIPRGTVRSWLSRARRRPEVPSTPEELEVLGDQAEALLVGMLEDLAGGDMRRALATAHEFGRAVDAIMLRDEDTPDEVLARLTVDPWTGAPLRGNPRDAAKRRRGY